MIRFPREFHVVALLLTTFAGPADSLAQCRNGVCRQRVVVKQRAVVVPQVVAPVNYQVGAHLQSQALATSKLRQSDEYIELQRLRGFREGVLAAQQAATQQATAAQPTPAEPHATKIPTLVANCAKCHSGKNPKGDIWLDGTVDLRHPDAAEKRDAILRAVYNGTMPKGKSPLDDQAFGSIIEELYAEQKEPNP